ncbi:MAG: PAS domain-containing protein, partial [Myxococcota bacterium]
METNRDSVPIELWIDQMPRDEAEETLKRLLQNSPGFFYHGKNDRKRTMQVLSGHFESITGFAPDELVGDGGLQYNDMIAEDDLERVHEVVERGLASEGRFQVSYRIETADGQTCWLLEYGRGINGENGVYTHLEGFVSDVTHEKTLEHRLRHSQKLEVIGRIAGEVAHDFNNLLSVILGYGSLALEEIEELDDDHPACKDLYEVIEAADRAKDLSGQILSFSRYQASAPEVIEVDSFLRDKISMVTRALGSDIQVDQHLDAGKSRIEIEQTQLEQVLLNLATNAQDAMEDQPGTLRIVSRTTTFDAHDLPAKHLETAGEYVVIEFHDQGHGIPKDVREKIFEPYFTTKPREKGTGLGL